MLTLKEKQLLRLIDISKQFIDSKSVSLSYNQISDYMLELADAKYVVFNIYNPNGKDFTTVASSGVRKNIQKAIQILGFKIEGKIWDYSPFYFKKIKDKSVIIFNNLNELTDDASLTNQLKVIQTLFKIGNVIIVNVVKNNEVLGDFTLMMEKNQSFVSKEIVELYASQVAFLIDKTKVTKENENLKNEYERFFAVNVDLFCIADMDGNLINVNHSWETLLGYSSNYLKTRNFLDLVHPDDIPKTKEAMSKLEGKQKVFNFVNRYKSHNGDYRYIEWIAQPYDHLMYASGRDITDKYERQQQVEFLSFRDYLTGLYNRRYMEEALKELDTPDNLPLTFMVLDVNGLKLTNDAFGHKMGDKLLQAIANIMLKTCGTNGILGRVGGDEFIILLPNTNQIEAEKIKQKMIHQATNTNLENVVVSFAIGYSIKTKVSQDITEIEKIADKNMYLNKLKYGKAMRAKTIQTVLSNINHKDGNEYAHTERTSIYCEKIAKAMKLSLEDIENARISGILHDIGNITISTEILKKPGKLTKDEWLEIKRHPVTGYHIIKGADEYASLADGVLYHHERLDGRGYPEGLNKDQIPLLSKIIAVADAYAAMTSDRPYKNKKSKNEALKELEKCAGTQFDPEIVKIFIEQVV